MTKASEAAARAVDQFQLREIEEDTRLSGLTKEELMALTQAAITAYLAAMKAEGFVMVPVEATDKICEAGLFANDNALLMGADCTDMRNAYRAMIAAATPRDDGGE